MAAATVKQSGDAIPWYSRWFNTDYLTLYRHRDLAEAERQVQFLSSLAPADRFPRVLDVGCGAGRHLAALSRCGFEPTGADLSAELLKAARGAAGAGCKGLVRCDMRSLPFAAASFELVTSFFTSFGYFERDEDHAAVAAEWRRVLRSQGAVLLDYLNPLSALDGLAADEEKTTGDLRILIKRSFDRDAGRIEKQISIRQSGEPERNYRESVRLFSLEELKSLLKTVGFSTVSAYGDADGSKFSASSARLVIFAAV